MVVLISPFAPHLAEELWFELGHKESIFLSTWPTYDETFLVTKEIKMPIQINGKVRDVLTVAHDTSEGDLKAMTLASEKVKSYLEGKEIKKFILVSGKLISIVI